MHQMKKKVNIITQNTTPAVVFPYNLILIKTFEQSEYVHRVPVLKYGPHLKVKTNIVPPARMFAITCSMFIHLITCT